MKPLPLILFLSISLPGATWKNYYTTPDSAGAYLCDFSGGVDACYVQRGPHAPVTPTIVGLPVDAPVSFVMDTASLSTTFWPNNVNCPIGDKWVKCGNANGYNTAGGKYLTTFWSDGVELWATCNTGNCQTFNGAHGNFSALQVFNLDSYAPGTISALFGTTISVTGCASTASPAPCGTAISGAVAIPVGATSLTVNDSHITNNSLILVTFDSTLSTRLGIPACSAVGAFPKVSGRVTGVSFTISTDVPPLSGPACYSFYILGN